VSCVPKEADHHSGQHVSMSRNVLLQLGGFGFFLGPAIDAIHNQVLLNYQVFPVAITTVFGVAKTSMIVPPLLATAYALLGGVLPDITRRLVGSATFTPPFHLSTAQSALLAVCTTAAIVRVSGSLASAGSAAGPLPFALLCAMALAQWRALDGSAASLALAAAAAILGPIAETPFMAAGAWAYAHPDYWPLAPLGLGPAAGAGWAGLSSLTGPCYFAVTTDAIALGRWLADAQRAESKRVADAPCLFRFARPTPAPGLQPLPS
jgi:hypothetical protein